MKTNYVKPVTFEEILSVAQIIATSPGENETPQVSEDPSEGGEGLIHYRQEDWGDLW